MTTDTTTDDAPTAEYDPDAGYPMDNVAAGINVGGHWVTDTVLGVRNENHDSTQRGAYPKGLDPAEFVGTLRRFVSKIEQYIYVVGDLDGHAVYRTLNDDGRDERLYALPWDRLIDETAHVRPETADAPDIPERAVVRTDFDTLRARREQEVETGCSCLPGEGCDHCGGKEDPTQ